MVRFFPVSIFANRRNFRHSVLLFSWLTGLIAGSLSACYSDHSFLSLMHLAPACRVSIVGLLTALLLPFLCSAFAVYISKQHWLLPIISFLKALALSRIGAGVLIAYRSAGWLICSLFLFSDILLSPILFYYWYHSIDRIRPSAGVSVFCFVSALVIGCFDFRFISPFLVNLLTL